MFAGEYLDDNIGHEIINLYKADSGDNYAYLCYNGEIDTENYPVNDIEHVVFVRRTEVANQIEILGFTEGKLEHITTKDQRQYNITYGGIQLGRIFGENKEQQNVNLTFKAQRSYRLYEPYDINKEEIPESKVFKIKTSLRGYIGSEDNNEDYNYIKSKIEDIKAKGILKEIEKLNKSLDTTLTMSEVYGIINRELSYSDALRFFIDRYSEDFKRFFLRLSDYNSTKDLGRYIRTLREFSNIDLIVEFENAVFVIENKIFSKLNGVKLNDEGKVTDQLDKYYNIMISDDGENSFKDERKGKFFILLSPDHNPIKHSHREWHNHKYSELNDFLKTIPTINSDFYLKDFQRSVANHCDVDYNFTIMNKRFIKALEKLSDK